MSTTKKILIIEDNAILSSLMQFILNKEGYEVALASTGKEALSMLTQDTVQLVITDLALPYMTGYEIIDQIRRGNLNKHVPIIIISDYRDDNSIEEGFKVGADDYMKKPISPSELISRVRIRIGQTA